MSKTPVSILQEMMVKKAKVPNYELIYDGGGSHENTFTYQVTCDGFRAVGTGRCKKDAKHVAAKAMLETIALHHGYLQLPASPAQSPAKVGLSSGAPPSPRCSSNRPFVNAVGTLQDLCSSNSLQDPAYNLISEVGPPHAKVFTMECVVSTFKEVGVAMTKKEAKHEAARKMYDRLMDIIHRGLDNLPSKADECKKQDVIAHEIAKARYPELVKQTLSKRVNLGLKMCDCHVKLRNSHEESTRADVISRLSALSSSARSSDCDVATVLDGFRAATKELSLEVQSTTLEADREGVYLTAMQLSTTPELMEIGFGATKSKADLDAVLKLIDSTTLLLQ